MRVSGACGLACLGYLGVRLYRFFGFCFFGIFGVWDSDVSGLGLRMFKVFKRYDLLGCYLVPTRMLWAFEALPPDLQPDKSQAVRMRWILTWKTCPETGNTKAKARAVLLGYQDPEYERRATTSPVMTRQTRQLLLQMAANRHWTLFKGDVSGAFCKADHIRPTCIAFRATFRVQV